VLRRGQKICAVKDIEYEYDGPDGCRNHVLIKKGTEGTYDHYRNDADFPHAVFFASRHLYFVNDNEVEVPGQLRVVGRTVERASQFEQRLPNEEKRRNSPSQVEKAPGTFAKAGSVPDRLERRTTCNDCANYVRYRSIAEGIRRFGNGSADVSQAMQAAQDMEEQKYAVEAAWLTQLLTNNQLEWPRTPAYVAHCRITSERHPVTGSKTVDTAFVAELKNLARDCSDFRPMEGQPAASCESCRNERKPQRKNTYEERNLRTAEKHVSDATSSISRYVSSGVDISGLFQAYHQGVSKVDQAREEVTRAENRGLGSEIRDAVKHDGRLPYEPQQFTWCSAWSGNAPARNGYALCAAFNADGFCRYYSKR
jgi:hypothetical protein